MTFDNSSNNNIFDMLSPSDKVMNFMGASNFKISPLLRLKVITSSWFRGEPQYYRNGTNDSSKKIIRLYKNSKLGFKDESLIDFDESAVDICDLAIQEALDDDFVGVLEWAGKLRSEHYMRTSPQVLLVEAAMHKSRPDFNKSNPGVFRKIASSVIQLPTDIDYQRKYYVEKTGDKSKLPGILKKCWADALENFSSYQISKYSNTGNIINCSRLSHPRSSKNNGLDTLMKTGKLNLSEESQTWENLRSAGKNWTEICDILGSKFPHMALLRNLRNIAYEFTANQMKIVMSRLECNVPYGKQFPFRYYTAYTQICSLSTRNNTSVKNIRTIKLPSKTDPSWKWRQYRRLKKSNATNDDKNIQDVNEISADVLDVIKNGLERCIRAAIENFPKLKGKVVCLSDNSGSAWGTFTSEYGSQTVATIGNLSSLITAMSATHGGQVGIFGDKLIMYDVDKNRGVLEQLDEINKLGKTVGSSTENGIWLWFKNAFADKSDKSIDHLFIYSDMQAGHGGLFGKNSDDYKEFKLLNREEYIDVIKLVKRYREIVNSKINIFTVQTAGYESSLIPEVGRRMAILAGWTGNEVSYAVEMIKLWNTIGF